jgi:excisionase family DNA binding protein
MTPPSPENRDYRGNRVFDEHIHPEHPEKPDLYGKPPVPPPLLKVGEVAQWLRLKESTIRKWVCRGLIPHLKLGRTVCFQTKDIEEWLLQRTHRRLDKTVSIVGSRPVRRLI